ncbi:hypothetical protein DXG03_001694 [Asterophora parasitica]|uniref:J domain-containing protein n=1 Tax=Asterophora parasitica TaxID=117018 RepID=A0A9P7GBT2_9AGAR|nr:hypothetical protein DXG03_001694 [Asterophora parasitica]
MVAKEPHEILGLPANASLAEIKQAYRQMALKWHPDRQIHDGDREHAVGVFAEATSAYQMLLHDLDAPTRETKKSKLHTRMPTPLPTFKSLSGSPTSSGSSSSPSKLSYFHSNADSQLTLPSSFSGSLRGSNFKAINRSLDHAFDSPASIAHNLNQVPSQATSGSDTLADAFPPSPPPRTSHSRRSPAWLSNSDNPPASVGWNTYIGKPK